MAKTPREIATGADIWRRLNTISPNPLLADMGGGHGVIVQPGTLMGGNCVYVLNAIPFFWYIKGDTLYEEEIKNFRNMVIGAAFAKAGESAAWVIPVWECMVKFALAVVPFGRLMSAGVSAFSIAIFFTNHKKEVVDATKTSIGLIDDLQELFRNCPKLGLAMLAVALQQSGGTISDEIRKKGLAKFVLESLDTEKYAKDIAEFLGTLLKWSMKLAGGSGKLSMPMEWMAKKGLGGLAKVAQAVYDAYMHYRRTVRLIEKGQKLLAGPDVKEKEILVAKFISAFADAGVHMKPEQASAIVAEGCLEDSERLKTLESLKTNADQLEKFVDSLSKAADRELF